MYFGSINSLEKINGVHQESLHYIREHNLVANLNAYSLAYHTLLQLIPETPEKLFSGHTLPFIESNEDLERSYQLCCLGFYKYSYISLRTVLELGLLSVYWDRSDDAQTKITLWAKSQEDTPIKRRIINGLLSIESFKVFQGRADLITKIDDLYTKLSNYVHTKGYRYSSRRHSSANYNTFSEKSLIQWIDYMKQVVQIVTTVHILKYPVALQEILLDEKFGLNGPMGGFLNPHDSEHLKSILDNDTLKVLQEISDADEYAVGAARHINSLPDITEEEFEEQSLNQDKMFIEGMGFNDWFAKNARFDLKLFIENPVALDKTIKRILSLKMWAGENKLMESKCNLKERFSNG